MFTRVDYIMVNVSDMRRSIAFYRDALGLSLKSESPGWSEFQTGETTLALHLAAPPPAAGPTPKGPAAGTCSIGFSVEDVDRIYAELESRGVRFLMPPTDQRDEGIRLVAAIDPDGLVISFASPLPA
jgi:lactoylglutathione lyase